MRYCMKCGVELFNRQKHAIYCKDCARKKFRADRVKIARNWRKTKTFI